MGNPVMPGYMPVFYFRTCDVTGKIETMASSEGDAVQMAMPGDDVTIECELIASISGRGTVATGRVEQGVVKKGDDVEILGRGKKPQKSVVTGIRMFNTDLPEGPAGYTVGVLCRGIDRGSVMRGQVICAPGATSTHTKFKANIYLSKKDEGGRSNPVMPGYMPVFYFRTCDVTGKIEKMASSEGNEVQMAMPGDYITVDCELIAATPIEKGMRFAMREGGKTIGQGLILETM